MEIVLNGKPVQASESATVRRLLDSLSLRNEKVAVEVNGEIVPRSRWDEYCLSAGDRTEIVRAIGGG